MVASMQSRVGRQEKLENSEIYFMLRGLPVEILLHQMAKSRNPEVKRCVSVYFTKLHGVRTQITGDDLRDLGVKPGPMYRELLDAILSARLNGVVTSREDELRLAKELIGQV